MILNFPRTKFVTKNGICGQVYHIASEAEESVAALLQPDMYHIAEEIMDTLHSCESALRILEEKHGYNLEQLRAFVEQKNAERGYYE